MYYAEFKTGNIVRIIPTNQSSEKMARKFMKDFWPNVKNYKLWKGEK